MPHVKRMLPHLLPILCVCLHARRAHAGIKRIKFHSERIKMNNQTDKTPAHWLSYVSEQTTDKNGAFTCRDTLGMPIVLAWHAFDAASSQFSHAIQDASNILVETYTQQEVQFTHKHPEAVPHEYFLKSLESLFNNGIENVDWNLVSEQTQAIIQRFFMETDFSKFLGKQDITIVVTARDQNSGELLGLIQLLVTPDFAYGNVRVGYYGVTSTAQARGLEKLLMSAIFKLLPLTTRIFLHTRSTNEQILNTYYSWGFVQFTGTLEYWPDLEYLADRSYGLQETAKTIMS